jgi:outer membrane protein assembly factor BamB
MSTFLHAFRPRAWVWLALACLALSSAARGDDWPQWLGPQRDGVWRETGILDKFPAGGPKEKWRVKINGGFAGPAVAAGRVFVTDFTTTGATAGDPMKKPEIKGMERVLCLDAADGAQRWEYKYDCTYRISYPAGPRCTPTVDGDRVYTLGAMGDLVCLEVEKGTKVWARDLKKDYKIEAPTWGFCGHPLVDGKKLICLVGGEGTVAVAFNKEDGKEIWRALSAKEPGYCPPSIIEAGGKRQLVVWSSESVNGLDPDTGEKYWSVPLAPDFGMSIAAPRKQGDYLFAGGIGFKAVLLKLAADKPAAEEVWRGKKDTAVYPVNSTPFAEEGCLYGVDQPGALRCVKLETGERLWETFAPTTGAKQANAGTAFLVKNGDRFFLFGETGDLVIARLTPKKYEEISRFHLLEPTGSAFGRDVVWSHPAFARKCVFARNDKEIVCFSLAADGGK